MGKPLYRLWNKLRYARAPERRFNLACPDGMDRDVWEREKATRWRRFVAKDLHNVSLLESLVLPLAPLTLLAYGSSTYGKRAYRDIDLLIETHATEKQLLDALGERFTIRPARYDWPLDYRLNARFTHATLSARTGVPLQLCYRSDDVADHLATPEILEAFRHRPYVLLIDGHERL